VVVISEVALNPAYIVTSTSPWAECPPPAVGVPGLRQPSAGMHRVPI